MIKTKFLLALFFVGFFTVSTTQAQGFSQEIGVIAGPVAFYSDYGLRNNLETNAGNIGMGIGLVHYINFAYRADCNCYTQDTYFNDHFKIRNEIDFHMTNLDHHGEWAEKDSYAGEQLRAMQGKTKVFEIGTHLEYFPLSIRDFASFAYQVAPFVSLGVHYVHYTPTAYSDLGPLTGPGKDAALFPAFENGLLLESGNTWALAAGVGMRYKLTVLSDLVVESRWHYYDSDFVDGLNHDEPQNKFNDWIYWFNVGYIYYLDF